MLKMEAADALATQGASLWADMVLTMWNRKSWSFTRKDFNYLFLVSVEEWYELQINFMFPIKILARKGLTPCPGNL